MSGFRAGLKGACGHSVVKPDMVTFGKVIGGGMPVGAFAAKGAIMEKLSPDGPVYQAGTLSGNPVAMAAGLASLEVIKSDKKLYATLEKRANTLTKGLEKAAKKAGIPFVTEVRGSMFGFFFSQTPVNNFDEAAACDTALFGKFHQEMLNEGVYLACSAFEAGFISSATTDKMIETTIKAAERVFKKLGNG